MEANFDGYMYLIIQYVKKLDIWKPKLRTVEHSHLSVRLKRGLN